MKKIAVVLLLGIMLVAAISLSMATIEASTETHNMIFSTSGCFPKHLPDSYIGEVALPDLNVNTIADEVQGVYWWNGDKWLFWAPGAPGCTLSTMGGGHTFDYLVCVTGACDWVIPLPVDYCSSNCQCYSYSLDSYITCSQTGAICNDGTCSLSTGYGTCSWHGGVETWINCP